MINFNVKQVSKELLLALENKVNNKTKPLGSLGKLEEIAIKIGLIQNTLDPKLNNPYIIVFASDHGIAQSGVSLYPQEVTYQMVYNFLSGGAGINVFSKQNGIKIKVVDAGVKHDFNPHKDLINAKIAYGTKNFLTEPAMTQQQCLQAIEKGSEIISTIYHDGCNVVGFGEMGIANTSSASILLSLLFNIPIEDCVGRGTGLDDAKLEQKKAILKRAIAQHHIDDSPLTVLSTFGGFEIAMMTGAMLKAAEQGMIILVDGFIATSALIVAYKLYPDILDYCIFAHKSDESGHSLMLALLDADPLLYLGLRLGEGTGAAVAYPVIVSAVSFLNEMASFESAKVSQQSE